jgi:hypothetical protein
MSCPLILHDLIILIILVKSTNYEAPHYVYSPASHSFLYDPNITLSTLFSYILTLDSSPTTRDQASHPNKTQAKLQFYNTSFQAPTLESMQCRLVWLMTEQYHDNMKSFTAQLMSTILCLYFCQGERCLFLQNQKKNLNSSWVCLNSKPEKYARVKLHLSVPHSKKSLDFMNIFLVPCNAK